MDEFMRCIKRELSRKTLSKYRRPISLPARLRVCVHRREELFLTLERGMDGAERLAAKVSPISL